MKDKNKPDQNSEQQGLPKKQEIIDLTDAGETLSSEDEDIIIELTDFVEKEEVIELTDAVDESSDDEDFSGLIEFSDDIDDTLEDFNIDDIEQTNAKQEADTDSVDLLEDDSGQKIFNPDEITVSSKQLDDALERVLKKMYSEKIQDLLCEKIEKAVTHEMDRLKSTLLQYMLEAKKSSND
ncbi:MAG: hypothetical protein JRG68_06680 [Deltaproteobacteria bacterium]|nr:hypothetical protein [Deltaproteobacteria bacterium]MBW1940450.1 hypothetical protein [Deltaproteobacteria bacterium]MBW2011253.1 hypothetical protein [Deltaproteobacteria bacterium]MBW2100436.1 hypothetical protein [Deltaproteobacteria bacterium]